MSDEWRHPQDLREDIRAEIGMALDAKLIGQQVDGSGRLLLMCVNIAHSVCLCYYQAGELAEVPPFEMTAEDVPGRFGRPRHLVSLTVRGRSDDKIWQATF